VAVGLVGIERDRRGGRQVAEPDLVETQGLVRQLRQGLHIDPMLEGGDGGRNRARADLQQVGAAGNQRLVAEPDNMSGELVDALWRVMWVGKEIATGNVDLAVKRQGDRVSLGCTSERTV